MGSIASLNLQLELWECLTIGLLALDIMITLYSLGSEMPDAVLPDSEAESVMVVAVKELLLLMQLLRIFLPAYSGSEFENLTPSNIFQERAVCKWIGGLFGTHSAEFADLVPKLGDDELKTFGLFIVPVAAAVVWKWRRLQQRLRAARRQEEAALIARVFRVWDRGDGIGG
ncbi:hypothetical protein CKAH01_17264 [Colletotrichum kahawae]|uniref:Uncharacterized protein n=1 Tax=Colletotrichum kahawae TaxID=34407 RepID=A0AAD9YBI5_COLKA|nr:hypothetical protein CKAH01_17264 [Colletotrichum kahawae]